VDWTNRRAVTVVPVKLYHQHHLRQLLLKDFEWLKKRWDNKMGTYYRRLTEYGGGYEDGKWQLG
jgi:hypothetical protein